MKDLMNIRLWLGAGFCVLILMQGIVRAQDKPSPPAKTIFNLNGNDITVNYSSPAVKGREIWGKLVPFNNVWRTGANENTTITFTKAVLIDGKKTGSGNLRGTFHSITKRMGHYFQQRFKGMGQLQL